MFMGFMGAYFPDSMVCPNVPTGLTLVWVSLCSPNQYVRLILHVFLVRIK